MFQHEIHKFRQAELIRQAEAERLARQVRRARRAARRAAKESGGGRVSPDNSGYARAA
ncbi:hypothetical protein ACQEVG_27310 [Streptomyces sp. CA-135486]|uniref:hypothetical protein n=1 Tax=Streptomyces sp. CA-135486 TaxID=3240049 RepID=UPI003D920DB2